MSDVGLSAELQLDISRALEQVTEVETSLTTATTGIPVEFDLSGVEQLSLALGEAVSEVPTSVDTSGAEAGIEEIDAKAGEPVDFSISADTSEAAGQIDGVQEQAGEPVEMPISADTSQAESSVEGLHGAVEGLHVSAEAATGSAAGLASAVGKIHPAAAVATGGALALTGATKEFFEAGVEATGAAQRFELVVGDMGDRIKQIHVGDFSTDMEHLGLEFGSTGAAMENANAKLYSFAINSGASKEAAVTFTQQVEVLAARAISLNPNLGSLSEVVEQMGPRLARGGRFASEFGVALTPAEIAARALADTGKELTSELTVQEKAMAGAEIAAERYGDGLAEKIGEGSKNAIVQQRSLQAVFQETLEKIGKPLVAPIFEVIEAAEPDVALLGEDIGQLVGAGLPLLHSLLVSLEAPLEVVGAVISVVSPALEGLATVIDALPSPITASIAGFFLFRSAITAAMTAMPGLILEASVLESTINPLAGVLGLAAAAVAFFGMSQHDAVQPSQELVDAMHKEGDAAQQAVDAIEAKALADNDAARTAHDAGVSYAEMSTAIQHGTDDFGSYVRAIDSSNGTTDDLVAKLLDAGAASTEFGGHLIMLAEEGKLSHEQLATYVQTVERLHNEYVASAEVTQAETAAIEENTGATETAAEASARHAESIKAEDDASQAYADSLHAALDPLFAMVDAQNKNTEANEKVTEAQKKLNDAVKAHGPNSAEAAAAARDLAAAQDTAGKSALDMSASAADLEGKVRSGGITLGEAKVRLNEWVAQGLITQTTADGIAARFQLVTTRASELPKDTNMELHLNDADVIGRLHSVGSQVQQLVDGSYTIEVDIAYRGAPGQPRAKGGPVMENQTYTVGEEGPEVFVPTTNGWIVPNNVLRSASTAAAGSAPVSASTAVMGGPRFNIETAYIGSEGAVEDLDWWWTTRGGSI